MKTKKLLKEMRVLLRAIAHMKALKYGKAKGPDPEQCAVRSQPVHGFCYRDGNDIICQTNDGRADRSVNDSTSLEMDGILNMRMPAIFEAKKLTLDSPNIARASATNKPMREW